MAESSARRVMALAAVAGALVGGLVAGVVAVASASGGSNGTASPAGSGVGGVATAPVVRTDLISTVQDGGSIDYQGSYTVAAPSGPSASQISEAQQTLAGDRETLSAAEQTESDATAADSQAITADEANVQAGLSALTSDQAKEKKACAGAGASTAACSQDAQQVTQDQTQLTQARQQLTSAKSAAKLDHDQNEAMVVSDQTRLQSDQDSLASLQSTAVNPGTTYTWLPSVGAVIRQDQPVYALSDEPVPLLYGAIAAWRPFFVGMAAGADVAELTRDLIRLGYGDGMAQSDAYTAATAVAVERWQRARGLPATGEILLGEVVFEPGPIRVTSVTPAVGAPVGGGGGASAGGGGGGGGGATVLTATGTTPVVTVDLDVSQEYLVKPGDSVQVVLPDGTSTVGGRIQAVGTVATCAGGGGIGTGASSAGQSPCSQVGSGTNSSPTVTVTITLDHTPAGATLDQAPVNVNITTQRADGVLAVPVNALLALTSGGYAVQVVTGKTSHLVGVTTGMYSNNLVQVSGPGIAAGMRVEVASS